MKQETTLRLAAPIRDAVKQLAVMYGTTLNAIMTDALIEHLDRKFGLIVRPHSDQNGITFVVTTRAQTEPKPSPQSAQTEPVVGANRDQKGDIGGSLGVVNQEEKETTIDTPLEPEPPKRKTGKSMTVASRARFERWYAAYPNHADVGDGEAAWLQHDPGDDEGVDRYIAAIRREEAHRAAEKAKGEFVPAWKGPGRWLRAKSYLNNYAAIAAPVLTSNPHPVDHRDWCRVDRQLGKTALDHPEQSLAWMKHRSFELSGDYGSCAL